MDPYTVGPNEKLTGPLEFEKLASTYPRDQKVKGMFFARHMTTLGSDFDAITDKLLSPPRAGRYVSFNDYPGVDHFRVSYAAALKKFPGVSPREAVRQSAREDTREF